MPWRGPSKPGEFPTLGFGVADWIEANLVIPDGERLGAPYLLTDEMLRFLLHFYRLTDAGRLRFYGAQLMRPQKWGKDPFMAAIIWAEALGPVRFDGWDSDGEPVGRPVPTPWIQCAATSEEQTDNTFRPIVTMALEGSLIDTYPGLDVGQTRVNLPSTGRIEPVTAAARSRLGQRLSFASFTESHLMTPSTGGLKLAAAMKRNLAGMGGRWVEGTNAYDPAEGSVAQRTAEAKAPGVFIDYRPPRGNVDLDDDLALRAEVLHCYGDSAAGHGGWVDETRIIEEIRDPSVFEGDARRFFLNQIVAGQSDFVDPLLWDALAAEHDLVAKDHVCLGFDGSRSDDHTVIWVSRIDDGRLFRGGWWAPQQADDGTWRVPRTAVDDTMRSLFKAYRVHYLFADPFKWQDYLDRWSAEWPDKVVEFPTNVERRFDDSIERFLQAAKSQELSHDGDSVLTEHVRNAVLVNGSRKRDREVGKSEFYRKVSKRRSNVKIDALIAAILAYTARGFAIEHGARRRRKTATFNLADIDTTVGV